MVVEDDPDIRFLVRHSFRRDPSFEVDGEAADLPTALRLAEIRPPDLIVLDHKLEGAMTGLQGAPLLKHVAPAVKIILFTASEELRVPAEEEPAVDAFLLKTRLPELLPLARRLLGLDGDVHDRH